MDANYNIADLYFRSKKISLLILAATAIICSRLLFFFFSDPEGPNLLIVAVLSLVVYALSAVVYFFSSFKVYGIARLLTVIGIQMLSIVVLYFCMR